MRRLVVVLGAAALLGLLGRPALADEPFRLEDQVVDQADVLGDESDIDAALEELQTEDGIQLFVVFVDSFDGMDTNAWMQSTEELSGLSGNDALLAVAVEDGAYGFDMPDGADVTRDEADQLAGQAVEPEFADGNWEAGVVAFADIVRTGEAPDSGGGGSGALLVIGAIAVVGGGGYLLARRGAASGRRCPRRCSGSRSRPVRRDDDRAAAGPGQQRPARAGRGDEDLAAGSRLRPGPVRRAGRRRVRPGPGAVARRALPRVHAAPATGRRRPGGRADHPADARRDAAAHRRPPTPGWTSRPRRSRSCGTWRTPRPRCSTRSRPRIAALHTRLPQEEQRLAELQQRFADAALAPVADNVTEARARLAAAEQEIARRARRSPRRPAGDGGRRHPGRRGRRRPDRHAAGRRGPRSPPIWTGRGPRRRGAGGDGEGPRGGPVAHRGRRPQRAAPADRPGRGGADLGRRRAGRRRSPIRWRRCASWRRPTSRWSRRCRSRGTRRCRTGGPLPPWSRP